MDWLSKHRAIVDCDKKIVLLKCSDLSEVTVLDIRSEPIPKVISAMEARNFLRKGCEAFLALIIDSKREQVNFEKNFSSKGILYSPKSYREYHLKEKWISLLK